jgi:hypothetical protein
MLGAVSVLSLGIHVYDRLETRSARTAKFEPEPPIASAPAPAAAPAPPVAVAVAPAPLPAPTSVPTPAPAPRVDVSERPAPEPAPAPANSTIFRSSPRAKGRWVVANQAGPDVDSTSLARAISGAAGGDMILLKPGLYTEPLEISGKTLTLRGLGAQPEEVLVTSPDRTAVLKIEGASVKLENLRIEPERGASAAAAAVLVRSGRLTLINVTARSEDVAILAAQGGDRETSVDASSSLLEGAYAGLLVRGQARVALKRVQFTNARQPIVVWRDVKMKIESCRFARTAETRLFAYEESSAAVDDSPTAPPVSRRRSAADADADRLRFSGDQPGGMTAAAQTKWTQNIFQKSVKQK